MMGMYETEITVIAVVMIVLVIVLVFLNIEVDELIKEVEGLEKKDKGGM